MSYEGAITLANITLADAPTRIDEQKLKFKGWTDIQNSEEGKWTAGQENVQFKEKLNTLYAVWKEGCTGSNSTVTVTKIDTYNVVHGGPCICCGTRADWTGNPRSYPYPTWTCSECGATTKSAFVCARCAVMGHIWERK